ncbi:hypothetical protein WAI453_005569 [Rhynchosporium graminicola]
MTQKQAMMSPDKYFYTAAHTQEHEISEGETNKTVRKNVFIKAFVILELIHIIIFLAFYSSSHAFWQPAKSENNLEKYFDLYEYNSVREFFGDWKKMRLNDESEKLLGQIEETDGVVAIDTQWALSHGYATTFIHPYDNSKGIYQIDMFHSMHCIHRIRNKLTSDASLQEWPRNDEHTLHCLDYLREQLMCNADLTLEGTDDLLHFNKTSGHICRDKDAIMLWAKVHHWEGHREFVTKTMG